MQKDSLRFKHFPTPPLHFSGLFASEVRLKCSLLVWLSVSSYKSLLMLTTEGDQSSSSNWIIKAPRATESLLVEDSAGATRIHSQMRVFDRIRAYEALHFLEEMAKICETKMIHASSEKSKFANTRITNNGESTKANNQWIEFRNNAPWPITPAPLLFALYLLL